jgi:ribosome-binding factor A
MDALRSSAHLVQREIASQLRMKRTPSLDFVYDDSIERADRVIRMLES